MPTHLMRELDNLKGMILTLGAIVEERIRWSIESLIKNDLKLAEKVIVGDFEDVDMKEVAIEEDCLKILALYQPVAIDLRLIITILKMNNDLERMADNAVNIAQRAYELVPYHPFKLPDDFFVISRLTEMMVKDSLDSLVKSNVELARNVCKSDDDVDDLRDGLQRILTQMAAKEPDKIELYFNIILATRHLERIADLATNVAEDVIYMVTGEIVRHGEKRFDKLTLK